MENQASVENMTKVKAAKETLLSRNFIIIVIGICALYISYQVTGSMLSTFVNSLGNGAKVTGILSLAWTISAVIVRPIAGGLCDVKGTKIIALIGAIVFAIGLFAMSFFSNAFIILILRIVQACGHACIITASLTAAQKVVPKSRAGEGAFYFNGIPQPASQFIGGNLGVALVGVGVAYGFVANGDYFWVFTCSAVLAFVALAANLLQTKNVEVNVNESVVKEKEDQKVQVTGIARIIEVSAILPASIYLLGAIGFDGLQAYVALYALTYSTLASVALFFTANGITQFILILFAGRITDKFGNLPVLIPAFLFGASSTIYLLLGGMNFFVLGVLWGLGVGLLKSPCMAMAMRRSPKGREGATQGTLNIALGGGLGFSIFLWGFVIDGFGFHTYLLSGAIISLAAIVYTIFVVKKMKM